MMEEKDKRIVELLRAKHVQSTGVQQNANIDIHKFRHHTATTRRQPGTQFRDTYEQVTIECPPNVGGRLGSSSFLSGIL